MRTRSSSNLPVESPPNPSTFNPKRRNRRRSKQPFLFEESPVDTMADQRTMAELLRAPTKGYAEQFELKHSLINMMTSDQFFGLEKDNPHDHIRWFNKITSTGQPVSGLKKNPRVLFSLGKILFQNSSMNSFSPQEQQIFAMKFQTLNNGLMNRFMRHEIDTKISFVHALIMVLLNCTNLIFYNALNPTEQNSLNSAAGGNLLERRTQDVLMIIENKSKVRNSRNKSVVSQVKSSDANSNSSSEIAKLTIAINQQTSDVTTAMTTILKQFQATLHPASVKAVEEICVTRGGAHPYYQCFAADGNTFPELRDNIHGYVVAVAVNYNQGNFGYRPLGVANQIRPSGFAQPNVQNNQNQFSQPQGYNRGNNLNQDQSYQAPTQQNQVVPLSLGSLPSNTIANPKGELKAITTRSGIVLDEPSVPIPPLFINPNEDERVEETLTDQDLAEYTIKVPHPLVQKSKPPSQRNFVVYQRDPLISNKEKLLELANTPLIENCSTVILKKLLEKLRDPEKFLIPCGFNELKCKALADLELFTKNHQSGNPTFSSQPKLTSPEVKNDVFNPDHVLKPFFPSPIPVEDIDSFLEKFDTSLSYSDISLPEFKTFFIHTEETNSGSTTTYADYSLPKYDSFLFEIEPDQGKLTSIVMKDNLADPRVHVPNVLTTHPTLMLDSDFIPSDNSLPEFETFYFDIEEKNSDSTTIHTDISLSDLECFNFYFKPDPGELTSIVDSGIRVSAINVNLPLEEDHSLFFAYVVWIFLSFLMYPVVPSKYFLFQE
nr:hypothetical protein [Tanacetum cinerariifolium]